MRIFDKREKEPQPVCQICGEECYDYYYEIDGDIYCEDCMTELFRKRVA